MRRGLSIRSVKRWHRLPTVEAQMEGWGATTAPQRFTALTWKRAIAKAHAWSRTVV